MVSPASFSVALKRTLLADSEKRTQDFETKRPRNLLLGTQVQRLDAEQDQLPCGSAGTSSGKCQETETCMVRTCHAASSKTPSEEMLDGQRQRMNIRATAHKGLLQKRLEEDLC